MALFRFYVEMLARRGRVLRTVSGLIRVVYLFQSVQMAISQIGLRSLALYLGQSGMNFENDLKKIYQRE